MGVVRSIHMSGFIDMCLIQFADTTATVNLFSFCFGRHEFNEELRE